MWDRLDLLLCDYGDLHCNNYINYILVLVFIKFTPSFSERIIFVRCCVQLATSRLKISVAIPSLALAVFLTKINFYSAITEIRLGVGGLVVGEGIRQRVIFGALPLVEHQKIVSTLGVKVRLSTHFTSAV